MKSMTHPTAHPALRWLPAAALVLGVAALSGCDKGASNAPMPRASTDNTTPGGAMPAPPPTGVTPEAPAAPATKP
ncbi:hypothetical protein GCM10027276_05160 [Comamonas piscis]